MEEAQYCQPCGHSPGSRASCSGVRWQACKATKLARHQNPCLSRSAEAACNSSKHPCKNVDPSSAPPGLPPLVFVDQSSGGRPPMVVFSPNASGRVQSNSYLFIFMRRRPEQCGSTPHPGQSASLFASSQQFPLVVSAPHPTVLDFMEGQTRGEAPNLRVKTSMK